MTRRTAMTMFAAILGIGMLTAQSASAADKTHEGTVVSVKEGTADKDSTLVMSDKDKKEHTHMIASTVKIMLNEKDAKLKDLKKGDKVSLTTDDKGKVKKVAATRDAK